MIQKTVKYVVQFVIGVLIFLPFGYFLFGPEILYKYAPRTLAVIEYTANFSPKGDCRIKNVKALYGTGEIRWIVVNDIFKNAETEHARGFINGAAVDVTCPLDRCIEKSTCGVAKIRDYKIVYAGKAPCDVKDYNLKYRAFLEYVDTGLRVDRFLNYCKSRLLQKL
jgi:hypothetical protein